MTADDLPYGPVVRSPAAHRDDSGTELTLKPLEGDPASIDGLLFDASQVTNTGIKRPRALLLMAAHLPDLVITHDGIASSLMLKNAGCIQAVIQGAATAMGPGWVPVGTGDAVAFGPETGLDHYRHGSTGEIEISFPQCQPS